jgi:hypothetical protein
MKFSNAVRPITARREWRKLAGLRQSAISNVNDANAIYAAFQFLVGPD